MTTLITPERRAQLLANGAAYRTDENFDPCSVVKLFTPDAAYTWLLAYAEPECPGQAQRPARQAPELIPGHNGMEDTMDTNRAADERTYHGFRDDEGSCHVRVAGPRDFAGCPLPPRLDLANKSPTGFEWGYGGSGPAQLALALCADALGDDEAALDLFQLFKDRVISVLPRDEPWTLTAAEVRRHCRELQARTNGTGRRRQSRGEQGR